MDIYSANEEYLKYVTTHMSNVKRAFDEYGEVILEVLKCPFLLSVLSDAVAVHDASKFDSLEFEGYRQYYYTADGEQKNVAKYNQAWLHHQNTNQHHPEYWIMRDDNSGKALEMSYIAIAEMLLDWQSMTYEHGGTVAEYYSKKGKDKPLNLETRKIVKDVIDIVFA